MTATFSKKAIIEIKNDTSNRLIKRVCNILLDKGSKEEIEAYINDLLEHGCVSGMEGSLIYYKDTVNFYNRFQSEINTMLSDTLEETGFKSPAELFGDKWDSGDPLAREDMNQNLLAWFAFEETVRSIAIQAGLII